MRLLLDTHVALWLILDDPMLTPKARDLIGASENDAFVSVASLWEIAIKRRARPSGPNALPFSASRSAALFETARLKLMPIETAHALAVEDLPLAHGDPFDRLLLAQAVAETCNLVTHDTRLIAYGDPVIAV